MQLTDNNQYIAPSELLISPGNKIYHLNLERGQLAETIITVGDPNRVPMVSQFFDEIESKVSKREFVTHTGRIGNKRLSVLSTGIGPDNIDIVINEVDALFNIDFETRMPKTERTSLNFIRLGTSGCIQPGVATGSLVLSSYGLGMDNLMHFYGYHEAGITAKIQKDILAMDFPFPTKPYLAPGSEKLLNALGEGLISGITITAPGFFGPQGRSLRLKSSIADYIDDLSDFESHGVKITNFEMETSAIYGLSNLLGHHALSCNVILANRPDKTFDTDLKGITLNMIKVMLERISAL